MFQHFWSQHIEVIEEIWSALKAADFRYADDMHVMPKLVFPQGSLQALLL